MAKFEFNNPGNTSYFTLELRRRPSDGLFPTSSLQTTFMNSTASGEFLNFSGVNENGLVRSNFVFSCVVPSGISSFDFTPSVTIPGSGSRLRGTGTFDLKVMQADPHPTESISAAEMRGNGIIFGDTIDAPPVGTEEVELITQGGDFIMTQDLTYIITQQLV